MPGMSPPTAPPWRLRRTSPWSRLSISLDAVCEIGTLRGGTLFVWCQLATPSARVISIDLPGGGFGGGYDERALPFFDAFRKPGQRLTCLRGSSHDERIRDDFRRALGDRPLDFLFIDGDHSYEGVKRDFGYYSRFVRSGGFVAFHDIVARPQFPDIEVPRFWGELKSSFHGCLEFITHDTPAGPIGIGLVRMP